MEKLLEALGAQPRLSTGSPSQMHNSIRFMHSHIQYLQNAFCNAGLALRILLEHL